MKKCPKCGSVLDWKNDIKFIDGHYYCNNCPESKKNKLILQGCTDGKKGVTCNLSARC